MEIFGIGLPEMAFIVLIALILLGPKDMVNAARSLGKIMRQFIMSPTWQAMRQTGNELQQLPTKLMREAGLEDLQKEVKGVSSQINNWEVKQPFDEARIFDPNNKKLVLPDQPVNTSAPVNSENLPKPSDQEQNTNLDEPGESKPFMIKLRRALIWVLLAPFRFILWVILLPFRLLAWLFKPVINRFKTNRFGKFLTEVPEDRPALDAVVDAFQNPDGILQQLDDVRKHLLRSLLALVVTVGISFWFTQSLVAFLATPVGGLQSLQAIDVTESIGVYMKVALMSGIALGTPYLAFEIWLFFAPGIMPRSKILGLMSIPLALVFFVGGMAFAYFVMLPSALPFLTQFLGISTRLRPSSYFDFVTGLLFWIGVAFEFPLVIFGISAMGFIKPKMLLKQWRIAVVLISIAAAAITPTIDPVNMALVMGPMIALYFVSILFSWLAQITSQNPDAPASVGESEKTAP